MTDKEIINEMAKVLHESIANQTWRAEKVAEKLYKIVVPEGSVVLSKEEYKQLYNDERASYYRAETLAIENDLLNRKLIDVRKETAEKIFNSLYQWLDLENIEKYGFVTRQKFDFLRKFREIYKQFGVR